MLIKKYKNMNILKTIFKLKNLEQEIENIKGDLKKVEQKELDKYMKMPVKKYNYCLEGCSGVK